jgi:hypothetical protein
VPGIPLPPRPRRLSMVRVSHLIEKSTSMRGRKLQANKNIRIAVQ